jgi:hypothetical protein
MICQFCLGDPCSEDCRRQKPDFGLRPRIEKDSTPWNRRPRKKLAFRSKKMAKLYVERRTFVAELLAARPECQAKWDAKCTRQSVDVHEILPRSQGGKIVDADLSNFLAVCRYCHDMIETHPHQAHERGFRKWSWEENNEL